RHGDQQLPHGQLLSIPARRSWSAAAGLAERGRIARRVRAQEDHGRALGSMRERQRKRLPRFSRTGAGSRPASRCPPAPPQPLERGRAGERPSGGRHFWQAVEADPRAIVEAVTGSSSGKKPLRGPEELAEAVKAVARLAKAEGVRIALVGGYALQRVHGSPRL